MEREAEAREAREAELQRDLEREEAAQEAREAERKYKEAEAKISRLDQEHQQAQQAKAREQELLNREMQAEPAAAGSGKAAVEQPLEEAADGILSNTGKDTPDWTKYKSKHKRAWLQKAAERAIQELEKTRGNPTAS